MWQHIPEVERRGVKGGVPPIDLGGGMIMTNGFLRLVLVESIKGMTIVHQNWPLQ